MGKTASGELRERSTQHGEPWQTNYVGSSPKEDCCDATGALGEAESAVEKGRIVRVARAKKKGERKYLVLSFLILSPAARCRISKDHGVW